ncbi:hypothetical protein Pcinc_011495 [Petrolisthes cinctipes]|uniref:Endonuclease/exonuclease/phosphatase domain-containing protein n=1 Tax=Petrolisthes cinctipes TaxID=88211 RepID=A0AAE1G0V3_PETCI|nr:hypothetical protein Pcinc_019911 [Petrolisthes cinctipes]KAK3884208.1 hypothetical protein Pcinc_011484 [Petrolisthes cinctipes]KAK3884219.1 hypothetical protein Pcinc_011495 [Petrolisthes cinctipes]
MDVLAKAVTSQEILLSNIVKGNKSNWGGKGDRELPLPTPDIILCGDFNLPDIKWSEGTLSAGGTLDHQAQVKALLEVADKALITQQIITPSR